MYSTLFRRQMEINHCCDLKSEAGFIEDGASATIIYHIRMEEEKAAAMILDEKEGPDKSTVFTYKRDNAQEELLKGDYFLWKDLHYFVYDDIEIVREVAYKKQLAYKCNAVFEHNSVEYFGYFVSSLAKYVDTTLNKDLVITNNEKPVIIMPHFD